MENVVTNDYTSILTSINSNLVTLNTGVEKLYQVGSLIFFILVILLALNIIKGV